MNTSKVVNAEAEAILETAEKTDQEENKSAVNFYRENALMVINADFHTKRVAHHQEAEASDQDHTDNKRDHARNFRKANAIMGN